MKWLIVISLVTIAKFGQGGVLKCTSDSQDPSCTGKEESRKETYIEIGNDEKITSKEAECLSGSEWESNCHTCRCSNFGVAQCVKHEVCPLNVTVKPVHCKPNTTFFRDCNECVCLDNGLGMCTLNNCQKPDIPKKAEIVAGKDCAPGTYWKSQCNNCGCSAKGYSYCTDMACLDHPGSVLRCAPGSVWKNDCNTCWCDSDGRQMCTKIGCVTEFKDITSDIVSGNPEPILVKNTVVTQNPNEMKKVVCVANRMFVKDCNTCRCNEDGTSFFCTKRICIPDLPDETNVDKEIEKENEQFIMTAENCNPDEVFEWECNICRCNADGKSFSCTRKVCSDQPDEVQDKTLSRRIRAAQVELPKVCQPSVEFRLDCNTCLCSNDGKDFSCTRNDCSKKENGVSRAKRETAREVPTKCVPGSVFDQGCNVCRCTEDGDHAVCTLKRCNQEKGDNVSENDVNSLDGGFRCNPGEQFRRDCNDCTCSADGRSTFCTVRYCDEEITPSA